VSSIVRFNLFEVSRLDRHRQLPPRAEHLLKLPQRNDRELVHRLAERLSSPGADADDAEMESLDLDDFVDWIDIRPEQPFGELRADHGRAPVHGDFRGADEPPSLGVVAREIDVFGSNPCHLDAVDGRIAVRHPRAGLRAQHHRRHQRAVPLDRVRILSRDARIRLHAQPLVVAAHDAELLDDEGVGAGLVENGLPHRRVEALNQRHHRDNRHHRDDVAENGHERPQFGSPDGSEGDTRCVQVFVHDAFGGG
jgi:hypothetical protein